MTKTAPSAPTVKIDTVDTAVSASAFDSQTSWQPLANKLYIAVIHATATSGNYNGATTAVTGNGVTWELVEESTPSATPGAWYNGIWRCLPETNGTSGVTTITFTGTFSADGNEDTCFFQIFEIDDPMTFGGDNGSRAVLSPYTTLADAVTTVDVGLDDPVGNANALDMHGDIHLFVAHTAQITAEAITWSTETANNFEADIETGDYNTTITELTDKTDSSGHQVSTAYMLRSGEDGNAAHFGADATWTSSAEVVGQALAIRLAQPLTLVSPATPSVGIVVADTGSPNTTDTTWKGWVEDLGWTATYLDDGTENQAYDLILISSSASATDVGTKWFPDAANDPPVVVGLGAIWDDWGLDGGTPGTTATQDVQGQEFHLFDVGGRNPDTLDTTMAWNGVISGRTDFNVYTSSQTADDITTPDAEGVVLLRNGGDTVNIAAYYPSGATLQATSTAPIVAWGIARNATNYSDAHERMFKEMIQSLLGPIIVLEDYSSPQGNSLAYSTALPNTEGNLQLVVAAGRSGPDTLTEDGGDTDWTIFDVEHPTGDTNNANERRDLQVAWRVCGASAGNTTFGVSNNHIWMSFEWSISTGTWQNDTPAAIADFANETKNNGPDAWSLSSRVGVPVGSGLAVAIGFHRHGGAATSANTRFYGGFTMIGEESSGGGSNNTSLLVAQKRVGPGEHVWSAHSHNQSGDEFSLAMLVFSDGNAGATATVYPPFPRRQSTLIRM